MKRGFGLYRHQLDAEHFRFARQCGATHLVVHWVDSFRSSRGKVPHYQETFIDDGVLIPDRAPQMTCGAPWHAGMAFACGWMKAALQAKGALT